MLMMTRDGGDFVHLGNYLPSHLVFAFVISHPLSVRYSSSARGAS
jgi:hypothetical protein